jgi:hypothetical protein
MEEISGGYLGDERMASRWTGDGFDFPPTVYHARDPNLCGLEWLEADLERGPGRMSEATDRIPLAASRLRPEGVPLTAAQAERLLSICVGIIELCAEVTGKIDPAVGTMVAYARDDAMNGILGANRS